MIKIVYGKVFIKSAKKLPAQQQEKLADLLLLITKNYHDQKLHIKPLSGDLVGFYSFRITRDWRVIFQFLSVEEIKLIRAGHRKDIYRKMKGL